MKGRKFAKEWMGKKVRFTHTVMGRHSNFRPMRLGQPREGWVVGYRYLRRGAAERDYDYGTTFISKGPSQLVILVCEWPGRKPQHVLLEHLELLSEDHEMNPPKSEWPQSYKDEMRKIMSEVPRDARGRWLKT